ncbi:MAG: PucR family transcriptional regulator [Pseudomonadota bacterium]
MTQVITRYFESAARARMAKSDLVFIEDFSPRIIDLCDDADKAKAHLAKNHVDAATISAYADKLASGGAVILVRAGFRPLGVAQKTRDVLDSLGPVDMGGAIEEVRVKDPAKPPSVYKDHPLVMTRMREPGQTSYYMANWPIPLISRRKPYTGSLLQDQHGRMADVFWPLTVRAKPYSWSLFDDHQRMANFPIGLISKRKPFDGFAFPRHARMANMILPLLSKRKPYTGAIIEKHARMANWPFPHLINGKRGNNALMPGAPRMANFPIPLLSQRKPKDRFAFPRHARMANFPIRLISKRKPFTGSIFSRHARMANFILPLVIRSGSRARGYFGLPTLSAR